MAGSLCDSSNVLDEVKVDPNDPYELKGAYHRNLRRGEGAMLSGRVSDGDCDSGPTLDTKLEIERASQKGPFCSNR